MKVKIVLLWPLRASTACYGELAHCLQGETDGEEIIEFWLREEGVGRGCWCLASLIAPRPCWGCPAPPRSASSGPGAVWGQDQPLPNPALPVALPALCSCKCCANYLGNLKNGRESNKLNMRQPCPAGAFVRRESPGALG